MEKNKSGIYKIFNKLTNKFYIGSATNLNSRWSKHKNTLIKNIHYNKHLQYSFNKYGEANFEFIILEECEKEKLIEREQYYLDNLKPEYNICKIAASQFGRIVTEETRKKLSISGTGRKHSEESKKKISIGQLGKKILKGEDGPFFGKKHSIESRLKISIATKNRKTTIGKGKEILMLDNENNVLNKFNTIREACKFLGKTNSSCSTIIKVCKNKPSCLTAFGYKWKYIEKSK